MRNLPGRGGAPLGALLLAVLAALPGCAREPGTSAVEVVARYSKFDPAALTVDAGTTVTFTVRNDDPIAHEFIVGTPAEQRAHEDGTDETHDGAPGAASLEPGETAIVTYTFAEPGSYEYACHLPGHYRYGMRATVTVT